ncbi:MAG: class I SAM-dependent methyltransferase [Pseudomonadota bacterium]
MQGKLPVALESTLKEVPETMLWTLHNRAVEAMREDGVIDDDTAVTIYKSIDYDYEKSFGKAEPSHAIRSLDFDKEIRRFIKNYPDGTIVNLGEGLETQRFRIDDSEALWLSVDLPEAIEIREQFIQPDGRHLHIPISALDRAWFEAVPKEKPVFISAQGLFMYFTEEDVKSLVKDIENAFDHWILMFDTIPNWLSKKTMSKEGWARTKSYTTPKMPWGIGRNKIISTIRRWLSEEALIVDLGYSSFPRGLTKWAFSFFSAMPFLKNVTPSIVKIEQYKA